MDLTNRHGWKIMIPRVSVIPEAQKYLEDRGHTVIPYNALKSAELLEELRIYRPNAIVIRDIKADRAFFETAAPELKALARYGAGYDGVDLETADEFGVKCVYAPIGNSFSVAEIAMFHMLHASFRIEQVRKNMMVDFMLAKQRTPYFNLAGKTVGLIGCGNVGSRVAKHAMEFKMNVWAYDPFKPAKDFPKGVRVVRNLDELLAGCDYVSLHAPATSVTRNMINKETLGKMKPTAYLINTARGALVKEADVIEAIHNGVIAGAEFDTSANEPLTADREVLHTEGIYITPHQGGSTKEASSRACMMDCIGIHEIYEGKEPSWPIPRVNYDTAPTYDDVNEEPAYAAPDYLDIWAL
ncbi:MAG: NAD(P)-dependent oxidoreductase [Eubacteriales bacterium]|nr:NAD(P)-dependent oxidoreductase [Eubacteriales bacterium]